MNSRDKQNSSDRLRRKKRSQVRRLSDEQSAAVERFVTIDAISDLLGVCDRTVRRWAEAKKLGDHKFGGAVRITEHELTAFIAGARRGGAPLISPTDDTFYTVEDVADTLAVSVRTVRRRIKERVLVAHDFDDIIRIAHSDLRDYCERCRRR
jgi:excisionase family DNA binding protein